MLCKMPSSFKKSDLDCNRLTGFETKKKKGRMLKVGYYNLHAGMVSFCFSKHFVGSTSVRGLILWIEPAIVLPGAAHTPTALPMHLSLDLQHPLPFHSWALPPTHTALANVLHLGAATPTRPGLLPTQLCHCTSMLIHSTPAILHLELFRQLCTVLNCVVLWSEGQICTKG